MTDPYRRRPETLVAVEQLAYLERSAAHILAGWLPKVTPIAAKLTLGRFQHQTMQHATALSRFVAAFSQPLPEWRGGLTQGWRDYALAVDQSAGETELLAALFGDLKRHSEELAVEARQHADPVLDHHLCEELDAVVRDAGQQRAWTPANGGERRSLETLWAARTSGPPLADGDWLWPPIDRVPTPTRPAHFIFRKRGSISSRAYRATDPEHIRESFHGSVDDEITTMELFGRCSYEHPSMPEDFHRDMSRQISDESRHAQGFLDILTDYGSTYGDHPISTGVYDFHYQFGACDPGSRRELLWRLLLRSVMQEALSLDGFVVQIRKRDHHGQGRLARVLECLMADEIFHVRAGVRWSGFLCDGDRPRLRAELEQAHAYYVDELTALRRKFVEENPDEALAELEFVGERDAAVTEEYPFDLAIKANRVARRAAGMTEEEIDLVVAWGYASE